VRLACGQVVSASVGAAAARGGDAAEHAFGLTVAQSLHDALPIFLLQAVVGHRAAVGGDGGGGFVDGQGAVDKGQRVVTVRPAGDQVVRADVGAVAACGGDVAEHAFGLAVDQPAGGEAGDVLLQSVVGQHAAVGGDGGGGLVDGQGAVDEGQRVVTVRAAGQVGGGAGCGAAA